MIFKVWISSQSSAALAADRDRGALELILSTPLTTQDLIRGHWLSLKRLFLAPLGFLIACELFWILYVMTDGTDEGEFSLPFWWLAFTLNFLILFADLRAAGWLGLWMGVHSKNSAQAASRTQWRLLLLPNILVMVCLAFTSLVVRIYNPFSWMIGYWAFWSLVFDTIWTRRARWHLDHSLRITAIERYSAAPGGAHGWRKQLARWFRN